MLNMFESYQVAQVKLNFENGYNFSWLFAQYF